MKRLKLVQCTIGEHRPSWRKRERHDLRRLVETSATASPVPMPPYAGSPTSFARQVWRNWLGDTPKRSLNAVAKLAPLVNPTS